MGTGCHDRINRVSWGVTLSWNKANCSFVSVDKENSIRVPARSLSTYIQTSLFTNVCTYICLLHQC